MSERVLWVTPCGTELVVIEIFSRSAWPFIRSWADIESAAREGLVHQLENEPYANFLCPIRWPVNKNAEPEKDGVIPKRYRDIRDAAWEIIAPLVLEKSPFELITEDGRGRLIEQRAQEVGCSKVTIYKYLRKYWQRGQIKNACLPDYMKCGGANTERQPGSKKRGRPKGKGDSKRPGVGVNVTFNDRVIFRRAVNRFYVGERLSLKETYEKMLDTWYIEGIGQRKPADQRPTWRQFEYWFYKEINSVSTFKAAEGERTFNKKHRPRTKGTKSFAFGPGSVYIIDSTPADLALRSSRTGRLLSNPIVHLVIDLFTGMITGFYVGFIRESLEAIRLALYNAYRKKTELCAEIGYPISEGDWPCHGLSEAIWADRGPLRGPAASNLIDSGFYRLAQMPPYRPELKGDVESFLSTLKRGLVERLPGAIDKDRERGERDSRLDAIFDIDEFRRLLVAFIIQYNARHNMRSYPLAKDMIRDGVHPYPLDLWNWGIKNRNGKLRMPPEDFVRLHLLPGGEATVTGEGLRFRDLYYDSGKPEHQEWYATARKKKTWKVPIAWDPNNRGVIYLRTKEITNIVRFELAQRSPDYAQTSWDEYEKDQEMRVNEREDQEEFREQKRVEFNELVNQTLAQARARNEQFDDGVSASAQLKNIRANTQTERELERQKNAWDLGTKGGGGQVIPFPAEGVDRSRSPKSGHDKRLGAFWRAIQEEEE